MPVDFGCVRNDVLNIVRYMSKLDGASPFEFVESILYSRNQIELQWIQGECSHAHHPILHEDE